MNKRKYIIALASLLALTGCAGGNKNSAVGTGDSINSTDSISVEPSYELVFGKEIDKIMNEQFPFTIPSVGRGELISYTYAVDAFNDPTVFIYWDTGEEEVQAALDTYYVILSEAGFDVSSAVRREYEEMGYFQYTVYYANKVSGDVGVEIQFLEGAKDGKECMGIYVFTYPYYSKDAWPVNVVTKLVGKDIPHLPENGYEYDAMIYDYPEGNIGKIIMFGANYDEFYDYLDLFELAGYVMPEPKKDEKGKVVLDKDGKEIYEPKVDEDGNEYFIVFDYEFTLSIRFYFDYQTYYALVLEIYPLNLPENGTN